MNARYFSDTPLQHGTARGAFILLVCMLTACAGTSIEESRQLAANGQPEAALTLLSEAMKKDPSDKAVRVSYFRMRDQLVSQALNAGDRARMSGNSDEAAQQINLAQRLDPTNQRARDMLRALSADKQRAQRLQEAENLLNKKQFAEAEIIARALLAESPNSAAVRGLLRRLDEAQNSALSESPVLKSSFVKPITLEFRDTPLRSVFEAISRTAGINFVFDKDVRTDTKVTVFVRNTNIDEVVRMVLTTNGLERKMLNDNSMLIYPATPAKQHDYQELVTRTFYLTNTDAKQAQALIKTVVKTRDTFIDEKINMLIIKDTPDAIRMAERLIQQLDIADPEVMLDVEVLEVLRSRLLNLGFQFPDQIGLGLLQPTTQSVVTTTTGTTQSTNLGGQLQQGNINLRGTGALVPYVSNPGLLLNLQDQDGDSNILANPRIRVRNREKAKIHIGDKLPVFTTTSTANVGVSASVNYLEVGLKLDVEPVIHLDDDVEIKVGLEVSSVTKEVAGPQGSLAYQIGTRNADTVLRLRDGETQVLAGLISDEERSSASHLPGIGRVPILGHLFSNNNDSNTKTEIILLITPHVVRNIIPTSISRSSMPAGTDTNVGATPMRVTLLTLATSLETRGDATGTTTAPLAPPPLPSVPNNGGVAALTLAGPTRLTPGQEFSVTVNASSDSAIRNAEVTLSWDGALFEAVSGGSGNSMAINLAPAGNAATAQLRLRAKIGANGDGLIEVSGSRISGSTDEIAASNPQALVITVAK
ncbi:MAG: ral secretion pathway protein GspD [Rhodocyclales bacterium]|nr:ral secretion pathway protein GspD [Rhodocyclales bacterium]